MSYDAKEYSFRSIIRRYVSSHNYDTAFAAVDRLAVAYDALDAAGLIASGVTAVGTAANGGPDVYISQKKDYTRYPEISNRQDIVTEVLRDYPHGFVTPAGDVPDVDESVFANGVWDDDAVWDDTHIWSDAA